MRLLLDAHLSWTRIAEPLRRDGHDVLALQQEAAYDALADAEVLALAAREERILVTRNSKDFAPLLSRWGREGRAHSGCILIWTLAHPEYAAIVAGVEGLLAEIDSQSGWQNLTRAL